MKRCDYCRSKLNKKWNFCPICGNEIEKPITITTLLKRQMDILRNLMRDDIGKESSRRISGGITIKINSTGFHEPRVQVIQPPNISEPYNMKKPEKKFKGEIIEPEVNIKRMSNEMIIEIDMPDVKSESDVEVNRFFDSIEIRGYGEKKGYFKIIKIPSRHTLMEKKLNEGKLTLKFGL
ncbi:MAG: zinc ribbon domain-containing protein [Candidatus Aenigmatarchaeota archaeon]